MTLTSPNTIVHGDSVTPSPSVAISPVGKETPRISIVMPVYRETVGVLSRTIDSIRRQSFADFELIIVVDNPEHTEAIEYFRRVSGQDRRVSHVVNERNLGVWPSYNRGIRLARGEYLAIQDADDISLPLRLERTHDFLVAHPDVDVVGTAIEYVSAKDESTLMIRQYSPDAARDIKRFCPVAHGTTLRKRSLHERFGFYDESPQVRHAADYDLWIRWHLQGVRFANLPDVLYKYYQSDVNFKNIHTRRILLDTIAIKRRHSTQLQFSLSDRLHLAAERLAAVLPAWAITRLFYYYNSWRAAKPARK